jgi:D-glucuronyl C5-epimerase C-terminus/Putative peptidoglycan binding domain
VNRDAAPRESFWEDEFGWEQPRRRVVSAPPRRRTGASPRRRGRRRPPPAARRRPPGRDRAARRAAVRRRRAVALLALVVLAGLALHVLRGGSAAAPRAPVAAKGASAKAAAAPSAGTRPAADASALVARPGQRGAHVRALQAALAALGYLSAAPDGGFGPATGKAVAAFQRDAGLPPIGSAGPRTASALLTALDRQTAADARAARRALTRASASGSVPAGEALRDRSLVDASLRELGGLPVERAAALASVLHGVVANLHGLDGGRARTLFATLDLNRRYLEAHPPLARGGEVRGPGGLVYRAFPPYGLQLHPLASFGALNVDVSRGRRSAARRLAASLLARAIHQQGALVWEYEFPFGGPSRWTSGFVQAVAADALARAGSLLADSHLRSAARSALRAIPQGLVLHLGGGLWIREYGYTSMPILNAQLQTLLSLRDYARVSHDPAGRHLAGRLEAATRRLLPRFDAGCWSLYSLGGHKASRHYHAYHVQLLRRLAAELHLPAWARLAQRWARDLHDSARGCPA